MTKIVSMALKGGKWNGKKRLYFIW
jgi:hypothetical protein